VNQIECRNPVQSHLALTKTIWPWVKAQNMAGQSVTIELRLTEDSKTDAQRRYYHKAILTQIADQVATNGQKFPMPVWKEYFREKYLGFKTKTVTDPVTGKNSTRRMRTSTEGLGVKAYTLLIEQVTAFAVTELGVRFQEVNHDE